MSRFFGASVIALVAIACGGQVEDDGASSPAGSSGGGASSDTSSTSSNQGSGVSYSGCIPYRGRCKTRDIEFKTQREACIDVDGATCYDAPGCGYEPTWCRHYDATKCKDAMTCEGGWSEVKACSPDFECKQQTACGRTITCQKVTADCDAPAPSCGESALQLNGSAACPAWESCFTVSNSCGLTMWCDGY